MIVTTVLRSGGEYTAEHAAWFAGQLLDVRHVCMSDVDVPGVETVPLAHSWPGYWSKLNLFNPDGPLGDEDLVFFDIDTVITGDISDILALDRPMMLRDWYWPNEVNSSVMVIPAKSKSAVWRKFMQSPQTHMRLHRRKGDQEFIGRHFNAGRIQDELPGQVVSYKVHVADRSFSHRSQGNGAVPNDARVVAFHGKPRPWSIEAEWVPSFEMKARKAIA